MATVNEYDKGDRITVNTSTTFQDSAGTAFDPDVVTFKVLEPGQAAVSYVYGVASEVTKNGTGDYTLTIDVETEGRWHYRVQGETSAGVNRGADDGQFDVRDSVF